MTYADHYIHDKNGIRRERVTDEWILENKPKRIALTPDNETIRVNVGICLIVVQLMTPILSDGKVKPLEEEGEVIILVDGQPRVIKLDKNGRGELEISSAERGTFIIKGKTYESNIVQLEVV